MKKQYIFIPLALLTIGYITYAFLYNAAQMRKDMNPYPMPPTASDSRPAPVPPNHDQLFTLVNAERIKAGVPALIDDPRLDASASAKCADEDLHNYHAHVSISGTSWESFIRQQVGATYDVSENLAWDYPDSEATVKGWLKSTPHREAMLNPHYVYVGYAVCGIEGSANDVVQHFRSN